MLIVKIVFNGIIYPDRSLFRFISCNSLFLSIQTDMNRQPVDLLVEQYAVDIDRPGKVNLNNLI